MDDSPSIPSSSRRRRRSPSASSDSQERSGEGSVLTPSRPAWLMYALGLFPVAVCLLGSLDDSRIQAAVAAVVGCLAVLFPPRGRVPVVLLGLAVVILGLPLLTVIELPWPKWPAWRMPLIHDLGLPLPSSWSAQPFVTLEIWAGTLVATVWLSWCALFLLSADDRSRVTQALSAGLIGIAVSSLAARWMGIHPTLWDHTELQDLDFGPFSNRNHLSTLMSISAVLCLACAYDLQRRRAKAWLLYGLGIVPVFTCILLNTSRAGIGLFFVGVIAWFATSALRKSAGQRMAIAASILLGSTAAVVLFGKHIVEKLSSLRGGVVETIVGDGRSHIFKDALSLIGDHPALGVGLGNFAAVFGMTNTQAEPLVVMAHPESDWLLFMAEAGWPATLALIVGIGFMITLTGPWAGDAESSDRRSRRFRTSAAIAAGLSILHGIVDTPNHNRAHLLVVCLLVAMALRPRKLDSARGFAMPWLFRLAGLACLAASATWVLSLQGKPTLFGVSDLNVGLDRATAKLNAGNSAAAAVATAQVIRASPLYSPAYTLRAQVELASGGSETEAIKNFSVARILEPNLAIVSKEEMDTWMRYKPVLAMGALRELLRRDPIRAPIYYSITLNEVLAHYPELKPAMLDLAISPHYLLYYVVRMRGPEFKTAMDTFLQRYPTLEGLTAQEVNDLLHTWQAVGDRNELFQNLVAHHEWRPLAWPILAEEYASRGDAKKAYGLARDNITPPLNLQPDQRTPIAQLERDFLFSPTEVIRGLTLAKTLRSRGQAGDRESALTTLTKLQDLPGGRAMALLEMAGIKAEQGEHVAAWGIIKKYLAENKVL